MAYKVQIEHKGLKTGHAYKVGDLLKPEDMHDALLNSNNQYHIPFIVEVDDEVETPTEETENLEDLTVNELKTLAEERDIEIPHNTNKAGIIDLLNND